MVKLLYKRTTIKQMKADVVAVFLPEDKRLFQQIFDGLVRDFGKKIDDVVRIEKFRGKESELVSILTEKKIAAGRLFLVGLGEIKKLSLERYRRAAAVVAKKARSLKVNHIAIAIPPEFNNGIEKSLTTEEVARAILEGASLALYRFDKYITKRKEKEWKVKQITVFNSSREYEKSFKKTIHETSIICQSVYFARDLANAPASEIYPETLAEIAKKSAERYGYKATIWDKKKIKEMEFGGLLAVNSGSSKPPRFIILEYDPGTKDSQTIVLIGKGITFDSGGISIKPSGSMSEMKMDMAGAAAVVAIVEAAARTKLQVHLVGLIPATENLPSGSAMKPGDIIKHYGGQTSEVENTDAEGRLILADTLAYAKVYKPKVVIDLATLTGSCVIALGHHATGMMGNSKELMEQLKQAGEKTFERVWELPLFEEYEKQIKSDVADVKNTGGKWAGAITAGLFLKKFVSDYPWVHLDIAGTAIMDEEQPYIPKGGSGVGVRLILEFLTKFK